MNDKEKFAIEFSEWEQRYPELTFLSLKMLEYQERLKRKEITELEYNYLLDSLINLDDVEKKLKIAIKKDRLVEALKVLKQIGILAARIVVFL